MFGFIHDSDGHAMTFLHKSSDPKFHIPYRNPRYGDMSNSFTFHIQYPTYVLSNIFNAYRKTKILCRRTSAVHDLPTETCSNVEQTNLNSDCYMNYLETQLDCELTWNVVNCQFPFVYNNKTYTDCTSKWCATAVYPDREAFLQH